MKPEPVKVSGHDIEEHLRKQAERQEAARRRLAIVDRRYREYMTGSKPT